MTKLARKSIKKYGSVVGMEQHQDGTTTYFKLKEEQLKDFEIDTIPLKFLTDEEILNNIYSYF